MSEVVATPWEPLAPIERRVLGVLIEKQKTSKTADAYPMTLNSLTTGCNQKSNRDPVMELSDDDVEETLAGLGRKGLTMKMTGGRADRYRHLLYEVWKVSKVEMAIVAELLLRGPQSEGDLRGRASRMDEIADLDQLRSLLNGLKERHFVVYLTDPDRRGAMLTHGFHLPEELAEAKRFAGHIPVDPVRPSVDRPPAPNVVTELETLKATVAKLRQDLDEVRSQLGMPNS